MWKEREFAMNTITKCLTPPDGVITGAGPSDEIKELKKRLKEATAKIIKYSNSYRALKRRFVQAQTLINGLRAINAGEEGAFEKHYNNKNGS